MEILAFIGMLVTLGVFAYLAYIMSKPHKSLGSGDNQ
jgi:hypothetical protein